jgi:hypothetical protein
VPWGKVYLMPNSSNAETNRSRRSAYSCSWAGKKLYFPACSNPAAAASCIGELEQKTIRVVAANDGLISESGPISQPIRHPVAAKASIMCFEIRYT